MPFEVAGRQRLLDHLELKLIQNGQVVQVRPGVGAVCVDGQLWPVTNPIPYRPNNLEVGTRMDLELDPPVPLPDGFGRRSCRLVRRPCPSKGNPGRDLGTRAPQQLSQRQACALRRQVPTGHLDCGTGHRLVKSCIADRSRDPRRPFDSLPYCLRGKLSGDG